MSALSDSDQRSETRPPCFTEKSVVDEIVCTLSALLKCPFGKGPHGLGAT